MSRTASSGESSSVSLVVCFSEPLSSSEFALMLRMMFPSLKFCFIRDHRLSLLFTSLNLTVSGIQPMKWCISIDGFVSIRSYHSPYSLMIAFSSSCGANWLFWVCKKRARCWVYWQVVVDLDESLCTVETHFDAVWAWRVVDWTVVFVRKYKTADRRLFELTVVVANRDYCTG